MKRNVVYMLSKWVFSQDPKLKKRIWIFLGGTGAVLLLFVGVTIWGAFQAVGFIAQNLPRVQISEQCLKTATASLEVESMLSVPIIQTWNQLSKDCLQNPVQSKNHNVKTEIEETPQQKW